MPRALRLYEDMTTGSPEDAPVITATLATSVSVLCMSEEWWMEGKGLANAHMFTLYWLQGAKFGQGDK